MVFSTDGGWDAKAYAGLEREGWSPGGQLGSRTFAPLISRYNLKRNLGGAWTLRVGISGRSANAHA